MIGQLDLTDLLAKPNVSLYLRFEIEGPQIRIISTNVLKKSFILLTAQVLLKKLGYY